MDGISLGDAAIAMAFLGNVAAHFYRAGKVDARLKAIENTLNNGLGASVQEHGEDIAALKVACKTEVSQ